MWDEVQKCVTAERADGQGNQEAEKELEEDVAHQGDEDDAQQRQQANDGDGDKSTHPGCTHTHTQTKRLLATRMTVRGTLQCTQPHR